MTEDTSNYVPQSSRLKNLIFFSDFTQSRDRPPRILKLCFI